MTYDAEQFHHAAVAFSQASQGAAMARMAQMLESAVNEAERLRAGSGTGLVLFPVAVCPSCSRFAEVAG